MVQMEIYVKEVGKEPKKVSVSGSDTADTIRELLQLGDAKIRLKQRRLKKGETLESCGVKTGDALMVFANNQAPKASGTGSYAAYQAKQRLRTGRSVSTYKHKDLHEQTKYVVLAELAHLGRKVDALGDKVQQLTDTLRRETVPLEKRQEEWIRN